jgi:hypothetical protein
VGLGLGLASADLIAQAMQFGNGTFGMKVGNADEDGVHTSGDPIVAVAGVRTAACGTALSGSANDYNVFQFDANGNLCINIATNGAGSATDTDDGVVAGAQANAALTIGLNYSWDGAQWVRPLGSERDDDDDVTAANFGVSVMGLFADETATDSVNEGDVGGARMTLDRKVITAVYPHTAGGLAIYRSLDLDEGTGEVIKASAGQLYSLWVTNTATATRFVKIYNATSCTMGTGTPVITIGIPGNASDDIAGHFTAGGHGIEFTTGICFGATTGVADADTGAPGANDIVANAYYK